MAGSKAKPPVTGVLLGQYSRSTHAVAHFNQFQLREQNLDSDTTRMTVFDCIYLHF